jgi:E3 ubiquitin-protein ligase RNF19A
MPKWTLFVQGDGIYSFSLEKTPNNIKVSEVKSMIATKTGLSVESQRLYFAGKDLRDEVVLSEYMIGDGMTIFLVQRLFGGAAFKGADRPLPSHLPKSQDICTICAEVPCLSMPCGHPYCSNCVAEHAWNEASQTAKQRSEVNCCLCGKEWSFPVLKEYGAMTQEEVQLLANCLSTNYYRNNRGDFIQCPGCQIYCERVDKKSSRVRCYFCHKNKTLSDFCWYCKKAWKSGDTAATCGNCNSDVLLKTVKDAPQKDIIGVMCPSIRLCPKCGMQTEHIGRCKHITCAAAKCKAKFCFICLRQQIEGSWACGSYNTKCSPAPIQTSVPKL